MTVTQLWRFPWFGGAVLIAFGFLFLSGCSSTCGIMLVSSGRTQRPSPQQFAAIKQELAPKLKAQRLELVSDLSSAELIATIEFVPRSDMPDVLDVILRDLGPNPFARSPASLGAWVSPSMQQSNREQDAAMRNSGGSVPGSYR
jgi:hypothetical protein